MGNCINPEVLAGALLVNELQLKVFEPSVRFRRVSSVYMRSCQFPVL